MKKILDFSVIKTFIKVFGEILKIYLKVAPFHTIGLFVTEVVSSIRPLLYSYLAAKALDQAIQLITKGEVNPASLIQYLFFIFIFEVITNILGYLRNHSGRVLRQVARYELEFEYIRKLNSLSIQDLEDPDLINKDKRAREWLFDTLYVYREVVNMVASFATAITSAIILFHLIPWLVGIMILWTIFKFFPNQYFSKKDFKWEVDTTEDYRNAMSNIHILDNPRELLEVKINNAFNFFRNRAEKYLRFYMAGRVKISKDRSILGASTDFIGSGINIFAIYQIFMFAIEKIITVGDVLFYKSVIDTISNRLDSMLLSASNAYDVMIKMIDLLDILEKKSSIIDGNIKFPENAVPEIEFKNVSFKYPGTEVYVFNNLNLKVNSGESIALVGHNGAGKTTIVKLLTRIYDPTNGEIIVNGRNLKDYKMESWHKVLGVLFQEYSFYGHLSSKNNIFVGDSTKPIDEDQIVMSAINADADEFIQSLPLKYDNILGEGFEGGIRPSSGQRQKIAIARFFYRDAPLAIFDEPTAAIDAVSEYKIFNRIYGFFKKKTVIIISHRFSTVRNAERIIVIDHGEIKEEGNHADLMKLNGIYAHSFNLQAAGYKD